MNYFCFPMRVVVFILLFFLSLSPVYAQQNTGLRTLTGDSSAKVDRRMVSQDSMQRLLLSKSFLPIGKSDLIPSGYPKRQLKKGWVFYYLFLLLLLFASLKFVYPRYLTDLMRVFFRTSLKANQIKDQLVQSYWQSFLFNGLFLVSAGFYLYLLTQYFSVRTNLQQWLIPLSASAFLLILYVGKFLFLKISGWLFQIQNITETYIFIVFLVCKMLGVVFLPFLTIMAFAPPFIADAGVVVSLVLAGALLIYRFLLGYESIVGEVRLSRFHFMVYVLSMEVIPLLMVYRLLRNVF